MKPKNQFYLKIALLLIIAFLFPSIAQATTITVCPSGCAYSSIQSAINGANIGDTIEVQSGTYFENVNVNKQIVLRGVDTGAGKPIVDAGRRGNAITLSAEGVMLEGFNATNSGRYWLSSGIKVTSNNNVIKNSTASNNDDYGISLYKSSNNTLLNNTANSNNRGGIHLYISSNNTLLNNTANSNGMYGVLLWESSNNTLKNNKMSGNRYNFGFFYNYELSDCIQYIDKTNQVNGKPIYYLVNEKNMQIPSDAGYVGIVNSENITVKNLTLSNNVEGVLLVNTNNSRIENVMVSNNWHGIYLHESSNNTLSNNNATNNDDGIYLSSSSNNTLFNNNASNNDYGIYLYSSRNNTLKNNEMSGNIANFGVDGNYFQNIDKTNQVNGKPIYYLVNEKNMQIPSDAGYVGIVNSENITVKDLTLNNNNREGVLLAYTNNSRIENVIASNNVNGIRLSLSNNNSISNNNASDNVYGISLYGSSNNTLYNNTASNHWDGIFLWFSSNNKIYLNNFINNKPKSYSSHNVWNSTNKITYTYKGNQYTNYLGNYWDDYTGSDADNDGIGDTPYSIDSDKDNYPLMEQFENYIGIPENKPPIAEFTYSPLNPSVNQEITFDASSSSDPDGDIVKYEWDFGDDKTGEGKIVKHSYSKEGSYQVKLTVTDNEGASAEKSLEVKVGTPQAKTITVCAKGCDYTNIQSAIDGASTGDIIEVQSGIYEENVNVNKQIILRGVDTGAGMPVVDAGGSGSVITISADGVMIEGFEARNSGYDYYGIKVTSDNNIIKNNNASNNWIGIGHRYSSNNTILNNNASNNKCNGIDLMDSSNNTISNNNASNNKCNGIILGTSSNNNITGNHVSSNDEGIQLWGSSNNNTIYNNTVNSNNYNGIGLRYSSNNTIYLNNFINNNYTVFSYNSTNIWNSTEKIAYTYNGNQYTNYLGNYWDDYTGTDLNGDGIGDTPYSIDGDKDNYPLMEPFENYIGIPENQPPIAEFTYLPENPNIGDEITFDASSSSDPDGDIVKYEWDFGDEDKGEGKVVSHSYSKEGSYQVKLTVTDNEGAKAHATVTLTVSKKKIAIPTGKGMWIWKIWEIENGDVNQIIEKLKSTGINWVIIKIGDSDSYWLSEGKMMYNWLKDNNYQDFSEVIDQFHQDGIKVYGWHYVYSYDKYNIKEVSEADVSNKILDLKGIDGLILNAEKEYEDEDKNGDGIGDLGKAEIATQYLKEIREKHQDSFLAYSTFARISSHKWFPYLEFGKYCDAVMPQAYWKDRPTTPENEVKIMKDQWDYWHEKWRNSGSSDSIKPIIPVGQAWSDVWNVYVSGSEIIEFSDAVYSRGYNGVSIYRYGKMKGDLWDAYAIVWSKTNFIKVSVYSKVQLHALDQFGRHVGVNETSGEIEVQIPEAEYSGKEAHPQWIVIYNTSLNLTFYTKGIETGTFNISIEKKQGLESEVYNYTNLPTTSSTLTYLNSTLPSVLKIDENGDGNIEKTISTPFINFTYSPLNPKVNQTITFNASLAYDQDGYITSYIWDLGDNTTKQGVIVNHSYLKPGNYRVTLTVKDNDNATNSITDLLNIKAIKGDFNGNGRVDIGDATYVAYMVVGKVPVNMDADFNNNGRVDIGDAAKIAYYVVGKISNL